MESKRDLRPFKSDKIGDTQICKYSFTAENCTFK